MLAALTLCLALQSGPPAAIVARAVRPLHVFVEDESGTLLVEGWSVRVGRVTSTAVQWSLQWTQSRGVDATTGLAELDATSDEAYALQAVHDTGVVSGWVQHTLRSWDDGPGPIVHRIVFEGPTPERSLFVTVLDPLELSSASTLPIFAVGRTGAEIPLRADPDERERYVARDVEPGSYRIELRDPRYARVLLERHTTGELATALLTGSGSVHVRFVDAVDGQPVAASSYDTLIRTESTFQLSNWDNSTPGAGGAASSSEVHLTGLVPGASVRIEASFDAHCNVLVELSDFTPGEARLVTTQVDRGRTARGAIVDPEGAAVADVPVTALNERGLSSSSDVFQTSRPRGIQRSIRFNRTVDVGPLAVAPRSALRLRPSGRTSPGPVLPQQSAVARMTTTDPAGQFVLRGLAPEVTRLQVRFSPWHQETLALPSRAERVAPGPPLGASTIAAPVVLQAPGSGGADLQFQLPSRTQLSGIELALRIGDGPWLRRDEAVGSLFDEGTTIRLRGLPLVPCRLVASVSSARQLAAQQSEPSLTFDFVPSAGFPTFVPIDLTPLAPLR